MRVAASARELGLRRYAREREEWDTMSMQVGGVQQGWVVYGRDGKKIGEIDEVTPTYLKLRQGLIFKKDVYVPLMAVAQLRGNEVHLSVPQSEIEALGWHQPPFATGGMAPGAWATVRRLPVAAELAPLVDQVFSREKLRIPIRAERVEATVTPVITGEVVVSREREYELEEVAAVTRSTEVEVEQHIARTSREVRAVEQQPVTREAHTVEERPVQRETRTTEERRDAGPRRDR